MNNNYQAPDVEIVKLTDPMVQFGADEVLIEGQMGLSDNIF